MNDRKSTISNLVSKLLLLPCSNALALNLRLTFILQIVSAMKCGESAGSL